MFERSIKLFKLFGFEVKLDPSWFILGILITWSLSKGLFPYYYKGLPSMTYWWMGAAGALGLFFSIVFHEYFHSFVAQRFGLPMKGITLFIFGGVAEMQDEPPSPKAEFLMAIAGPISSVVIGSVFYGFAGLGSHAGWPVPMTAVLEYLGVINWILAGFNMIPAFPLDGGRVLRSALWKWKKNLKWSTKLASQVGSLFGLLLIFLGIANFLGGNIIGGIWWFVLGLFLRNASRMSYRHIQIRQALEGDTVNDFMKKDPVAVPPSISLRDFVEDFAYKYHFKMFPVVEDGKLKGCITTRRLKDVPKKEWDTHHVQDMMLECSVENTVTPETDAVKALSVMNRTGNSRLMVLFDHRLVGVITLKDIMGMLSVKMDLEDNE